MSKTTEGNPFDAFDILKGNFVPTDNQDEDQDDIETGIVGEIKDDDAELDDKTKASMEAADKALAKVIEKQTKANSTKQHIVEDEVEESEEDESPITTNGYLDAIKDLRDKGILDIDTEDLEDSEEAFEKSIQETITNRIKKHVASLGDEAVDFLSFVENGGNPRDFISTYYNEQSWSDYSLETEASQKVAIRESLRLSGETPEDIEDLITEFEDNGTLEKRAKSALNKLTKFEEQSKAELVQIQKQRAEQEKAANQKYWNDFKSDLDKREDIKGFKVTSKVKDNLWNYMTTIDKNTGKTAYQKAVEENQDASLLFAYLAMNDFDISKLEKQVASKAASKVAGILKNYQPNSKDKISGGRTHVDKDGEDPFALFNKIKS